MVDSEDLKLAAQNLSARRTLSGLNPCFAEARAVLQLEGAPGADQRPTGSRSPARSGSLANLALQSRSLELQGDRDISLAVRPIY